MELIKLFQYALIFLFGFYFLFIIFLLRGIFRLKNFSVSNSLKATVIVPFRNEEKNLRRCVQSILAQNFEKERFEIILVDDNSSDKSIETIKDFLKNGNIKLVKLEDGIGKKKAIEKGIKEASNEIIVTTDADCTHNRSWLSSMINSFDDKTGFVAGKVVYNQTKNIFEAFQKIEFASLVSIGAAFIGNKIPLLANGASCAYRKDLFYQVNGFKDNVNLASGDEEFLMQKIHFNTEYEVKFCSLENSATFTEPVHSVIKFINQRKRWVSKVPYYKNKFLLPVLAILYSFYILFTVSVVFVILNFKLLELLLWIFILKLLIDLIFMIKGYQILEINKNRLELVKLILLFPLAEIFHFIYISFVPILSFITGFSWKGREFKK